MQWGIVLVSWLGLLASCSDITIEYSRPSPTRRMSPQAARSFGPVSSADQPLAHMSGDDRHSTAGSTFLFYDCLSRTFGAMLAGIVRKTVSRWWLSDHRSLREYRWLLPFEVPTNKDSRRLRYEEQMAWTDRGPHCMLIWWLGWDTGRLT